MRVELDFSGPTYFETYPRAMPYWPLRDRGRQRVVPADHVAGDFEVQHRHVYLGNDTYHLTDDDVEVLAAAGVWKDGTLVSYPALRKALIEAGESAATLDQLSAPNAVARLRVPLHEAGRGIKAAKDPKPRTAPRRKPDSAPERVAKVLKQAHGRPFSYEDLCLEPTLANIMAPRDAVRKARERYPEITRAEDADGWAVFHWED